MKPMLSCLCMRCSRCSHTAVFVVLCAPSHFRLLHDACQPIDTCLTAAACSTATACAAADSQSNLPAVTVDCQDARQICTITCCHCSSHFLQPSQGSQGYLMNSRTTPHAACLDHALYVGTGEHKPLNASPKKCSHTKINGQPQRLPLPPVAKDEAIRQPRAPAIALGLVGGRLLRDVQDGAGRDRRPPLQTQPLTTCPSFLSPTGVQINTMSGQVSCAAGRLWMQLLVRAAGGVQGVSAARHCSGWSLPHSPTLPCWCHPLPAAEQSWSC